MASPLFFLDAAVFGCSRKPSRREQARLSHRVLQLVGQVQFFPAELDIRPTEVAVGGRRLEDRLAQLQALNDAGGRQIDNLADSLGNPGISDRTGQRPLRSVRFRSYRSTAAKPVSSVATPTNEMVQSRYSELLRAASPYSYPEKSRCESTTLSGQETFVSCAPPADPAVMVIPPRTI